MENSNSKSTGLKIALGILLALFLATGFYTSKLYNEKKENEATLNLEKNQVMADLNSMAKQYDIAIGENEITNERLEEARGRIQGLMDSLKISQNSVGNLWRYKKKFMALQKEMTVLMTENDALKVENSLLASSLDSTNVQLAERTVFTDSLLSQNTQLANIVENAAVLQTTALEGAGVIERSSGKLIPTERARRSDKIRVCYTVAKNTLVGAGDKELYVQIIDPLSNVLGSNEQIQFDTAVLNYSLISKFNYENKSLNICEYVAPNDDFKKGRYIINIFNNSELVSTSEFVLR
jgi:regulator of replication initiation timing